MPHAPHYPHPATVAFGFTCEPLDAKPYSMAPPTDDPGWRLLEWKTILADEHAPARAIVLWAKPRPGWFACGLCLRDHGIEEHQAVPIEDGDRKCLFCGNFVAKIYFVANEEHA